MKKLLSLIFLILFFPVLCFAEGWSFWPSGGSGSGDMTKAVYDIGANNIVDNADAVTAANEATDTTCFPLFVTGATGALAPKTNAGLAFNSNTGMLTATGYTGPLTGTATGNIPLSLIDAAGDIIVGSADNTAARVAKGSNNTVWGVDGTGGLGYHAATTVLVAEEFIDAGGMVPDTCSGLLQVDTGANLFDYLAFDGATDQYALFRWTPPSDWDLGTIKAKFIWAASAAMTNGHTVIFGLNGYAVSDGDTSAVAFSAGEVTVSDAYATGDETGPKQKTSAASTAITIQGTPAAGDVVYFRVSRDANTDTSEVDAWLLGVIIQYGLSGSGPTAW